MTKELILELHRIGVIKFGQFELKRDFISPFQVDFSTILPHPDIAKKVCGAIWEKAAHFPFDVLCGGSPIGSFFAQAISLSQELPAVIRRADSKQRGLKILGAFKSGQRCLLIEDLFLSGSATLDVVDDLEDEGLEVRDCVAFLDIGLGGKQKIKGRGFVPHTLYSIEEVINILFEGGKIGGDAFKLSTDFLETLNEK